MAADDIKLPWTSSDLLKFRHNAGSEAAMGSQIKSVIELMQGGASAESWVAVLSQDNYAVVRGLAHVYGEFHKNGGSVEVCADIIPTLYAWSTLDPTRVCTVLCGTSLVPTLCSAIIPNSDLDQAQEFLISAKLNLLDYVLVCATEQGFQSLAQHQQQCLTALMGLLGLSSESIYKQACRVLLLVNLLGSAEQSPLLDMLLGTTHASDFSEAVVRLLNRPVEDDDRNPDELTPAERTARARFVQAVVKFVRVTLKKEIDANKPIEFFYTNDVWVILDVALRRIDDSTDATGMIALVHCLRLIVLRPAYKDSLYKAANLLTMCRQVAESEEKHLQEVKPAVAELKAALSLAQPAPPAPSPSASPMAASSSSAISSAKTSSPSQPASAASSVATKAKPAVTAAEKKSAPSQQSTSSLASSASSYSVLDLSDYEKVVAKYAYKGGVREDRELLFDKGDELCVAEKSDGWWYGFHEADPAGAGWFPSSYVKIKTVRGRRGATTGSQNS